MTPERWTQVRSLFDQALEVPTRERDQWLQHHAGDDRDLLAEVRELLSSFEQSPEFLERSPLADALPDPYEGTTIGAYELVRRVGRGGMGSVYAGVRSDGQYRKIVAIKLVNPGLDGEEVVRRFRNERQVLAGLDHPNIARLLDGGTTSHGLPYLVMEYVEGQPIDQYCQNHGLSIRERLTLFRTVCDAVHAAHQSLVIHRDLKPGNILVTVQGVPKLLDFGIAKLLRPPVDGVTIGMTRAGVGPMTPDYASPEQVRGDPITTASDVYSLGVLLYKLLTGQLPYRTQAQTAAEVERTICETLPAPPSEVARGELQTSKLLKGDLDMIALMTLRKEPHRRYLSAERLSDDIRRHLEGMPVSAQKDTFGYRLRKFVARHRAPVAAVLCILMALVAALIVSIYYWQVARDKSRLAEDRFQSGRHLTRFVLVDLDDAMEESTTTARRKLVEQALPFLERLSRDAAGDASIQEDLVAGYLKMGDLQGSLFGAHVGEADAARASYEKALAIAKARLAHSPGDPSAKLDLAKVTTRLSNFKRYHGQADEALTGYGEARRLLGELDPELALDDERLQVSVQTATLLSHMGRADEALTEIESALKLARDWRRKSPASEKARLGLALALEWNGRLLGDVGQPLEGLDKVAEAISTYRQLSAQFPDTQRLKRHLLVGLQQEGDLRREAGREKEAAESFRESLVLAEENGRRDPRNQQAQRDIHTACARLLPPLLKLGHEQEARRVTAQALGALRPLIEHPKAAYPDVYQYAWILATTPFAEFQNPRSALSFASRAVAETRESDPWALDVLAHALEANGDRAGAIRTEQRALALLPKGKLSAMRIEFETNLRRWSAAARSQ